MPRGRSFYGDMKPTAKLLRPRLGISMLSLLFRSIGQSKPHNQAANPSAVPCPQMGPWQGWIQGGVRLGAITSLCHTWPVLILYNLSHTLACKFSGFKCFPRHLKLLSAEFLCDFLKESFLAAESTGQAACGTWEKK